MSFIDLYRELHSEMVQKEFPPSARVLMYTLTGEFNSARWIDELVFSERDLVSLTGLKKTTLHEAKHYLTSRNNIKCKRFKNKAAYSLGERLKEWLNKPGIAPSPTDNRPLGDQKATDFENSNIRARDKTFKTVKTLSSLNPRTSAFENWDCENELVTLWLDNGGARVTAELLSYLQALTEKNGVEWTASLIREAASAFSGEYAMSLNYLRGCAERKQKGGKKRGENQQHPSPQPSTHRSDDTIIEEDNPEWRELIALEEARRKESERKRAEYFAGVAKLQRFFFGTSSDSD